MSIKLLPLLLLGVVFPLSSFCSDVKVTVGKIKFLHPIVVDLPVSAEQQQLANQLKEAAKHFQSFEEFEKYCKETLKVPQNPVEPCPLWGELEEKIKNGASPDTLGATFEDRIKEYFHKGYMISGNQFVPVRLFLRQYYDDYKIGRTKATYDVEDISFRSQTLTPAPGANIVKITGEGEDFSQSIATEIAIKDALSKVNTYWKNYVGISTTSDGEHVSSKTTDATVVSYGGIVRRYEVLSCVKNSEGKYQVSINAEIEKCDASKPQTEKTATLITERIRVKNEYNTARILRGIRNHIPTSLITVQFSQKIPDPNLISITCVLSVNAREYQIWLRQMWQLFSRIAVAESSYATRNDALTDFFENKFSSNRQNQQCLFIGDFRDDSLQHINVPETVFYHKYELRKNLFREITAGFDCRPVIVLELLDAYEKVLVQKKIPFEKLNICFLQEHATMLPVIKDDLISMHSFHKPVLTPFFFDATGKISSSKVRIPFELQLPGVIADKTMAVRIHVTMSPQNIGRPAASPRTSLPEDISLERAKEQYNAGNYEAASRQFKQLAKKGHSEANYYMGLLAINWKNNLSDAEFWLSKNSDPVSLNLLGDTYLKRQNTAAALQAYRKSADAGNINGKGRYGKLLMKQDPVSGIKYLTEAADGGSRSSCYYVAEHYRTKGFWKKAFIYYQKALQVKKRFLQYNQCMYYSGYCYAYGLGTSVNTDEALFCLSKVSYKGTKYADAQYLSGILKKKIGKRKEAMAHFREGAGMQHPEAMYEYGAALLSFDTPRGCKFLLQAVSRQPALGFNAGVGLLKCGLPEKAAEVFSRCAAVPNVNQAMAFFQLGKMYESSNHAKAKEYYRQAAELKLPQAIYILGEMALKVNNLEKAHRYFLNASGYAKAEFSHAQLHENKNFSGYSLKEAFFRYNKAYVQSRNEKNRVLEHEALKNMRRIKRLLQSIEK